MSHPLQNRRHLVVSGATPYERGVSRGSQLRDDLPRTLSAYLRLFAALGVPEGDVRPYAEQLCEVVLRWDAEVFDELRGVSAGSGLETWQVVALNGRTEVLTKAPGLLASECSAVVSAPPGRPPVAAQTWDWHVDLDGHWHTQEVAGPGRPYVGLSECGMLAKVGVNAAGVGVLLNILAHRDDAPSGVPVHLLLAAVLGGCGSVAEAVDLLGAAAVSSSSALVLVDDERAVCVELSPRGPAVLEPVDGLLVHTNHFRDPRLASGDLRSPATSGSWDRYQVVAGAAAAADGLASAEDLVRCLHTEPGPTNVCCVPEPDACYEDRWATLATVVLEPAPRRARVLAGSPLDVGSRAWRVLTAR